MSTDPLSKGIASFLQQIIIDLSVGQFDSPYACRPIKIYIPEYGTILGRFSGIIGLPNLQEFVAAMNDLLTDQANKVILDLAACHLTRSGLGALVGFAAMLHGINKRLYLFRSSKQIQDSLLILDLMPFFVPLDSEDDIIMAFAV